GPRPEDEDEDGPVLGVTEQLRRRHLPGVERLELERRGRGARLLRLDDLPVLDGARRPRRGGHGEEAGQKRTQRHARISEGPPRTGSRSRASLLSLGMRRPRERDFGTPPYSWGCRNVCNTSGCGRRASPYNSAPTGQWMAETAFERSQDLP